MEFVLLHHITGNLHYDLMIDNGESLDTWQIDEGKFPLLISGKTVTARLLEPHRRVFLDYEGPVSEGRGRVERYDRGEYILLLREKNLLSLMLKGESLIGNMEIRKRPGDLYEIFFNKSGE